MANAERALVALRQSAEVALRQSSDSNRWQSPGGERRSAAAALLQMHNTSRPLAVTGERMLPVRSDLAELLPLGGIRRGTVAEIHGEAGVQGVALMYSLIATATQEGSWAAFVGVGSAGLAAAPEHGVVLGRVAVVDFPPSEHAATVVAALVDALDLVVVGPGVITKAIDARRLSARARERGSVVVSMGGWPESAELRMRVESHTYSGLGQGHGRLAGWGMSIAVEGRGAAARVRRGYLSLIAEPVVESLVVDSVIESVVGSSVVESGADRSADGAVAGSVGPERLVG